MSGVLTATGLRSLAGIHVRTAGGTKAVGFGRVRASTGTGVFYQSLASGGGGATGTTPGITVDKTTVAGSTNSSSTAIATSSAATVTVTGGVAPYTYAWVVTGSGVTANAATGPGTTFSGSVGPGDELDATAICTVTDAAGVAASSPVVSIKLRNIGGTL